MAKCPRCGRKGLFLKLTDYNLCKNCTIETQRIKVTQARTRSDSISSTPVQKNTSGSAAVGSFVSSNESTGHYTDFDGWKALNEEYESVMRKHEQLMEQIGAAYAIVNELKSADAPEMDRVIQLCKEDIALASTVREYWIKYDKICGGSGSSVPKNYPTFSRLAIIYEKRKQYQAAIDVCAQAVSLGFTSDRTDGGMIGRAARLKRKLNQENSKNTRLAAPEPAVVISDTSEVADGIVTTAEELEYFAAVKALLHEAIDVNRISYKDTRSYLSIIVDKKTTKWICRLRVEGKSKSISIPDESGKEIRYPLTSSDDIPKYKEALKERIARII